MKKIVLSLISLFTITSQVSALQWCMIDTIKNDNPNYPMYVTLRYQEREGQDGPYGWIHGPVWPRFRGGAFIRAGGETIIPPNGSKDLQTVEVPRKSSKGHLTSEKVIQLQGTSERTQTDDKKEDDFELRTGQTLVLDPLRNLSAFAWLKAPIEGAKAISFWAQTEGDVVIGIGPKIGSDYLFKVILGQNESKIITKAEEEKEKALTKNNEFLVRYSDTVTLRNLKTNKLLKFDLTKKQAVADSTDTITETNQFVIHPKPKESKSEDLYDHKTLRDGSTVSFFNKKYLSGRFGGPTSLEPKLLAWEKWTIEKVDKENNKIKDLDKVRLLSAHERSYLVFNKENNLAENRYADQNPDNLWQVELVKKQNKKRVPQIKYPIVKKSDNPLAVATSGLQGTYWVSIIGKNVYVGYGYEPGKNLFLFRKLPEEFLDKMNYLGFSSNNNPVTYTNILSGDPIRFRIPSEKDNYISPLEGFKLPALKGKFKTLTNTLRSANKDSVSFEAKAKSGITVGFSSKSDGSDMKYEVEIGANNNTNINIFKHENGKEKLKAQSYSKNSAIPSGNKFYKYTVSINDGLISVFRDANLIMVWKDPDPFHKHKYISLGSLDDPVEYINITIAPPARIDLRSAERAYRESLKHYKADEIVSLKLVVPYLYWLQQSKHNLQVTDPIYKRETWKLVGLEQLGEHNFGVTISKSGKPNIYLMSNPQGLLAEKMIGIGADTLGQTGEALTQIPNPKVAAVGLALSVGANLIKGVSKIAFTPPTGVYTEASREAGMEKYAEPEIVRNTAEIKQKLKEFEDLDPSSPERLRDGINLHQTIFDKIISPDNAPNDIKSEILRNLKELYDETTRFKMTKDNAIKYNNFIGLLIKAHDNMFFLNPKIKKDADQKDELYRNINQLSKGLFDGMNAGILNKIDFPPYHGEYIWYTGTLPELNEGTVFFQASGRQNIIMGFDSKKGKVKRIGQPRALYQIIIGGWNNTITAICSDSDARTIETFKNDKENPEAMAPFTDYKTYWVSIKKGIIKFGIVQNGKLKQILEWKDPYPRKNIQYIGFSSWDAPIELKNIIITKPREDLSPQEEQTILSNLGEISGPTPAITTIKQQDVPTRIKRKRTRRKTLDTIQPARYAEPVK